MTEPIWNVRVTVIDLIPAGNAEDAIGKLTSRLTDAGFDVHFDGDDTQDAFESETLSPDVEATAREQWAGRWIDAGYGRKAWRSA